MVTLETVILTHWNNGLNFEFSAKNVSSCKYGIQHLTYLCVMHGEWRCCTNQIAQSVPSTIAFNSAPVCDVYDHFLQCAWCTHPKALTVFSTDGQPADWCSQRAVPIGSPNPRWTWPPCSSNGLFYDNMSYLITVMITWVTWSHPVSSCPENLLCLGSLGCLRSSRLTAGRFRGDMMHGSERTWINQQSVTSRHVVSWSY